MSQGFTRNISPTVFALVTSASYAATSSVSIYTISASNSNSASYVLQATSASWAPSEGKVIGLCMAYTPTAIGADAAEIPIPYSTNGLTPLSWSVNRINFRTQVSESISSSITIEKSLTGGIFTAVSLGTVQLSGSLYETYTGSVGTVISGNKMRFYVNELGTSQNWTITVEVNHI